MFYEKQGPYFDMDQESRKALEKSLFSESEAKNDLQQAFAAELIQGKFEKGGALVFVLDMAVTDDEVRSVNEGLWAMSTFGANKFLNLTRCPVTKKPFAVGGGLFGGGTGCTPARCYLCGILYDVNMLDSLKESRMPQFGYEIGKDLIMDIIMREEEHWLTIQLLKASQVANSSLSLARLENELLKKLNALIEQNMGKLSTRERKQKQALLNLGGEEGESDFAARKIKKELNLQQRFMKNLEKMRQELEHAHFAKPVCPFCKEAVKAQAACQFMPGRIVTATSRNARSAGGAEAIGRTRSAATAPIAGIPKAGSAKGAMMAKAGSEKGGLEDCRMSMPGATAPSSASQVFTISL
jgi:hypothetical protein